MASFVIASGGTISSSVEINRKHRWGTVQVPTINVGTLQVQVSSDDSTFVDVYDEAGVIITVVSSTGVRAFPLPAAALGARFVRIEAGAAQAGGERTLVLTLSND